MPNEPGTVTEECPAPQERTVCVDAQTLLAIAQALAHVQSVRELDEARLTVPLSDGTTGSMGGRAGLAVLKRILTLRRMVVLADKAAENPAWWRANRLAVYTNLSVKQIAHWCGVSEQTARKYIREPEIGEDVYEALPPENPFT